MTGVVMIWIAMVAAVALRVRTQVSGSAEGGR
jgi:hypothetical protein